jgi:hypothetical protein
MKHLNQMSIEELRALENEARTRRAELERDRNREHQTKELDADPDKVVIWLGMIGDFCEDLVFHAKRLSRKVTGKYNGVIIEAHPDSSPGDLRRDYFIRARDDVR